MITAKSNAKINLNLKIVGISNGYHLLNSVFVPIDIYDELIFSNSEVDEIIGMNVPINENIIYKAICLLRKKYHIEQKVKVIVKKEIPMQAGLGGGSSNAAFTLKALNELWNLSISTSDLLSLALELGSDVPFFIINKPSYVRGRGEIITPINYEGCQGILIFNEAYFNTRDVFKSYDNKTISFRQDELEFINKFDYINDLDDAIVGFNNYDKVKIAKNDLKEQKADVIALSGSGGSVFGLFTDEDCMLRAYNALKEKYKYIKIFKSLEN